MKRLRWCFAGLPAQSVAVILTLAASPAIGALLRVGTAVPSGGRVNVPLSLTSGEHSVGGLQVDILFDHTVVALQGTTACQIAAPLSDALLACELDAADVTQPCKTLHIGLESCGGDPVADGCPEQNPALSRLRLIVAATAHPNYISIPDGVVADCGFDVIDGARLPTFLQVSRAVAADVRGTRLPLLVEAGAVLVQPNGSLAPTWTPAPSFTSTPSLTPTPSRTRPPTPTRSATRTPLATRTATATLTPRPPRPLGFTCVQDVECLSEHCVDRRCCGTSACGANQSCGVSRSEGSCAALKTIGEGCDFHLDCASRHCGAASEYEQTIFAGRCAAAPPLHNEGAVAEPGLLVDDDDPNDAEVVLRLQAGEVRDQQSKVDVVLEGTAASVGGVQIDLTFDTRVVGLAGASACRVNPVIGDRLPDCELDPREIVAPCKTLTRSLVLCGTNPDALGCRGEPGWVGRFRGILAATAVPNNNSIPMGSVLFTCSFDVADSNALPTRLLHRNVVASDPFGERLSSRGSDALIGTVSNVPTPAPKDIGGPCLDDAGCTEGNCIDRVCCEPSRCGANESCAVFGHEGACHPRKPGGEACLRGDDCTSGLCRLGPGDADGLCSGEPAAGDAATATAEPSSPTPTPVQTGTSALRTATPLPSWTRTPVPASPTPKPTSRTPTRTPLQDERPLGFPCEGNSDCFSGYCIDETCCGTAFCPPNQYCGIAGNEGRCVPRRVLATGCNEDSDCALNNCEIGSGPPGYAGSCRPYRTPTPVSPGDYRVTPTPTPSPATLGSPDDDGCAVTSHRGQPGFVVLLGFGLGIVVRRLRGRLS